MFVWSKRYQSINETTQNIIYENQTFRTNKNFVEYCKILLKFLSKFAQLSSIFYGFYES
jgi:hypothetical protein